MLTSLRSLPVIAVCGASRVDEPALADLAYAVGAAIARCGASLACGGMGGVMEAACRGMSETRAGILARDPRARVGVILGILPGGGKAEANAYCDVVVPTGIGFARNSIVGLAGDAVLLVGGGSGTLSEAALAWQYGKPVVGLVPSGGWARRLAGESIDWRRGDVVRPANDPEEAVRLCLAALEGMQ